MCFTAFPPIVVVLVQHAQCVVVRGLFQEGAAVNPVYLSTTFVGICSGLRKRIKRTDFELIKTSKYCFTIVGMSDENVTQLCAMY